MLPQLYSPPWIVETGPSVAAWLSHLTSGEWSFSGTLAFLFFPSMNTGEVMLIALAAVMIFGGRLPDVLMQGLAQLMRVRRMLSNMWRETGLEDELRRVRREIETSLPREPDFNVRGRRTAAVADPREAAERARIASEDEEDPVPLGGEDSTPGDSPKVGLGEDRNEPVHIEPADGAIASGDDWHAEGGDLPAGDPDKA